MISCTFPTFKSYIKPIDVNDRKDKHEAIKLVPTCILKVNEKRRRMLTVLKERNDNM